MSLGQFGFLYVAMAAGMPPGLAALVLQAQVVFTIVIAAGVLRERPDPRPGGRRGSGAVGLVVVGVGRGGHVPLLALALCLLGALSWGIGNVVSRAAGVPGGLSLDGLVGGRRTGAAARAVAGARRPGSRRATRWRRSLAGGVSTLYTAGLASLVGYGIFNRLLARNQSAASCRGCCSRPVVAMASAWLLLDQRAERRRAAGACC